MRQVEEDNNLVLGIRIGIVHKTKYVDQREERCEEIYQNTTTRDAERRYVVQLPLKHSVEQ